MNERLMFKNVPLSFLLKVIAKAIDGKYSKTDKEVAIIELIDHTYTGRKIKDFNVAANSLYSLLGVERKYKQKTGKRK